MKEQQFIETLRIEEGKFTHPEFHQRRMEKTTEEIFGKAWSIKFDSIEIPDQYRKGVVKCRVIYDRTIQEITFEPYTPRIIHTLRLVDADPHLDYHLKYADRQHLQELRAQRQSADEIIIVRNGAITDTSYSNLVFFDGQNYITPDTYLLNGTCRQRLLHEGRIRAEHLTPDDLSRFKYAILINAMLSLEENIAVPIERIVR